MSGVGSRMERPLLQRSKHALTGTPNAKCKQFNERMRTEGHKLGRGGGAKRGGIITNHAVRNAASGTPPLRGCRHSRRARGAAASPRGARPPARHFAPSMAGRESRTRTDEEVFTARTVGTLNACTLNGKVPAPLCVTSAGASEKASVLLRGRTRRQSRHDKKQRTAQCFAAAPKGTRMQTEGGATGMRLPEPRMRSARRKRRAALPAAPPRPLPAARPHVQKQNSAEHEGRSCACERRSLCQRGPSKACRSAG
eukprot:372593-Pleurochrysis_carterae.AAC.4